MEWSRANGIYDRTSVFAVQALAARGDDVPMTLGRTPN
jgi:hypothetical protein